MFPGGEKKKKFYLTYITCSSVNRGFWITEKNLKKTFKCLFKKNSPSYVEKTFLKINKVRVSPTLRSHQHEIHFLASPLFISLDYAKTKCKKFCLILNILTLKAQKNNSLFSCHLHHLFFVSLSQKAKDIVPSMFCTCVFNLARKKIFFLEKDPIYWGSLFIFLLLF